MTTKRMFLSALLVAGVSGMALSAHGASSTSSAQGTNCDPGWYQIDTDNNGKINADEVNKAADAHFAAADTDNNGYVTAAEYGKSQLAALGSSANAGQGMQQSATQSGQTAGGGAKSSTLGLGDARDKAGAQNGSGQQNSDQFTSFTLIDLLGLDGQDGFSQADTDKSGALSPQETATAGQKGYDAGQHGCMEQHAQTLGNWFAWLDADNDGKLQSNEWAAQSDAPKAGGTPNANSIFSRADANSDGNISKDEWKQNMTQKLQTAASSAGASKNDGVSLWNYFLQ